MTDSTNKIRHIWYPVVSFYSLSSNLSHQKSKKRSSWRQTLHTRWAHPFASISRNRLTERADGLLIRLNLVPPTPDHERKERLPQLSSMASQLWRWCPIGTWSSFTTRFGWHSDSRYLLPSYFSRMGVITGSCHNTPWDCLHYLGCCHLHHLLWQMDDRHNVSKQFQTSKHINTDVRIPDVISIHLMVLDYAWYEIFPFWLYHTFGLYGPSESDSTMGLANGPHPLGTKWTVCVVSFGSRPVRHMACGSSFGEEAQTSMLSQSDAA